MQEQSANERVMPTDTGRKTSNPAPVTPPGVESGSGLSSLSASDLLIAAYNSGVLNHLSNNNAYVAEIYRRLEGSGHECAARKALEPFRRQADFIYDSLPDTQELMLGNVSDTGCPVYRPRDYIHLTVADFRRAALAQPCHPTLSREGAEKMADVLQRQFIYSRPDLINKLIADGLQSVSGSEDARLLDWLDEMHFNGDVTMFRSPVVSRTMMTYRDNGTHSLQSSGDSLRECVRAAIESEKEQPK